MNLLTFTVGYNGSIGALIVRYTFSYFTWLLVCRCGKKIEKFKCLFRLERPVCLEILGCAILIPFFEPNIDFDRVAFPPTNDCISCLSKLHLHWDQHVFQLDIVFAVAEVAEVVVADMVAAEVALADKVVAVVETVVDYYY